MYFRSESGRPKFVAKVNKAKPSATVLAAKARVAKLNKQQ